MSDRFEKLARELREDHQKTCEAEHLTIKFGLRSAEEAQALLDKRFDEKCAAAIRRADREAREECAKLVLSDEGGGDIDFIAMIIRARAKEPSI